jgi:tetratricopeptide (TPR) repeat protein
LSKEDAERAMRAYWTNEYDWIEADVVAWRYDESQNLAVLTLAGEGKPEWEGDDKEGRSLNVYGAGFSPPPPFRRPKEQDQTAPWVTDFPLYKRWTTVIRLPHSDTKAWNYRAAQMDVRMGGVSYWRDADLHGDVLRTTMSKRVLTPEITADEAAAVNKQLPTFDNKISMVFQYKREAADGAEPDIEGQAGKNPEKLASVGEFLLKQGKKDRALRVVDKALAIDPKSVPALKAKLKVLAALDAAKARVFADKAVKTNPDPRLALARAEVMIKAGVTEEGFAAMDAVFSAHPDDADLLADYVDLARQVRHLDHALEAASAAIKLDPANVVLRRIRSGAYFDLGRYAEAIQDMDEAIRMQPEEPVNLRNRASALSKLGKADAAVADLDEVRRMNPLDQSVDMVEARILLQAGRVQEAVAMYDAAVDRERNANSLNNRCWMRALANVELPGAEADCAEAVKLEPKQASYWDSYAVVALRAGRLDDALSRFGQALTLNPKLAASLYGRGLTKLRKGDAVGGNQDVAAARVLSPKVGDELEAAGIAPREIAKAP